MHRSTHAGDEPAAAQIGDSFAVEISGMSLWDTPSPDIVEWLRDLWSRHGVVAFRRQALSEHELVAFSRWFGQVEAHVRTDWSSAQAPEITLISNMRGADGQPVGGLGAGTDRPYGQDGGVVQLPLALDVILAGESPYAADYSGTILSRQARASAFWDGYAGGNPILRLMEGCDTKSHE